MTRALLLTLAFAVTLLPGYAGADELTAIIQTDLQTLGYEPGSTDGEATVQTVVAISKFQAEHDMEVTGEATPQLAGVIKAAVSKQGPAAAAPATAAPQAAALQAAQIQGAAAMDPAMVQAMQAQAAQAQAAQNQASLQAAQQACLQKKMSDAQEARKKKRGFGSLMRAVSRIGGSDISSAVAEASSDLYTVGATVADLESAAKDLGLTETEVEACRNPK